MFKICLIWLYRALETGEVDITTTASTSLNAPSGIGLKRPLPGPSRVSMPSLHGPQLADPQLVKRRKIDWSQADAMMGYVPKPLRPRRRNTVDSDELFDSE